jgi:hypothetical protein
VWHWRRVRLARQLLLLHLLLLFVRLQDKQPEVSDGNQGWNLVSHIVVYRLLNR